SLVAAAILRALSASFNGRTTNACSEMAISILSPAPTPICLRISCEIISSAGSPSVRICSFNVDINLDRSCGKKFFLLIFYLREYENKTCSASFSIRPSGIGRLFRREFLPILLQPLLQLGAGLRQLILIDQTSPQGLEIGPRANVKGQF